ncbi:MAG: glycosyltransferase [Anaerolineae bacterium]|nr:glycosyltransferase [Anaerolineae bacterium]MCB9107784.1 glycosyltransferase [Anaerolineales bacterium]
MHIAHFTNTYHPVISGVVRSIDTFRQALTELGHNVFIFAQNANDYQDKEPFVFRYPSIDLPMSHNFPLTIPISSFVDKVFPSLKPAVIHSHHPFLLGRAAANKAEEHHIPLVFTFHTRYREYSHYVALNQQFVKDAIDYWLGDYMQKCHHIVVPSDSIKQMLADVYGVTNQVTTVPTGIDLRPYQAADSHSIRQKRGWGEDKVLISIGRLAEEKNWKVLLAAAGSAFKQHPQARLVIIGDGEQKDELSKLAGKLGIAERVEFTGKIPFDEVPLYLKAADLFCFASTTETQGLVTMEALAAELPVVAVEASGTQDVVEHDRQGLLAENNPEALAAAINRVLDDEELYHRFKQATADRAAEFDMKRKAEDLIEVYHQAIDDQRADRPVQVDKARKIFELIIDEQKLEQFFGLKA